MSDDPVRTVVLSGAERYPFQDYFVRLQCRVPVSALQFEGAANARPSPEVTAALGDESLSAVVLCPSNPYLSIDPILAVPHMRELIEDADVPVVAVSPIIGGAAVKGPAAKIMSELGVVPSVAAIAEHYRGLIDGLTIDTVDADLAPHIESMGIRVLTTPILMRDAADRQRLAEECIAFAEEIVS
jgi:LPPG:FO 2-phospho-L-lactate transferase